MAMTAAVDAAGTDPLIPLIRDAHSRLLTAIAPLTGAQVAEPSVLPGWSRGHVLAHLAGLAAAAARQVEHALHGEQVDLYDGGRPARDAAIEVGAPAPAAAHLVALSAGAARLEALLGGLAPADWDRPVRFRSGVVRDMANAWWREVEIHLTDLDLGPTTEGWSIELCEQIAGFLAERVPAGTRLRLAAPDGWVRDLGAGPGRVLTGARTDLVAWLAGREPVGPIQADDGAALPVLGPWPSPQKP